MLRKFCCGCLLLFLFAGCLPGLEAPTAVLPAPSPAVTGALRSQAFQTQPCWGGLPTELSAECGFVTVPENRRKQDGGTIRLAVMILRQEGVKPAGEPTLLLGGGPGQDTIGLFVGLLGEYDKLRTKGYPPAQYEGQLTDCLEFRGSMDFLVEDLGKRELVVFDQRGAGYSEPSLKCHEERYDVCHERLLKSGIDLSGYNTRENAADVEAIRQALGYDRINLQGGSYSGEFDPGTPPAFAEAAADTLSHHYSYVFPSMGHTDGFLSRCWSSVQSQFLDDPKRAPDGSCIQGMSNPVFATE